jgi:hypothetical protein
MAGIVDALLGGALGFSSGLVQNAKQQQQTEAEEAKETRRLGREAFLMELRSKYNKDEAAYGDQLTRGRAEHQQQLQLDGLNAPQAIEAEQRKRQGTLDDHRAKSGIDYETWATQNGITHKQALELLRQRQDGDRSLMAMRNAAKGKGGADDDDAIGDPDFIGARKGLYGYLGIDAGADEGEMRAAKKRLGLPDNATPKVVQEVMKAATNVYAANPNLSPDEALKFGSEILYGKIKLGTAPVGGNGRQLQYFTAGGRRYGYGRPN